MGSDTPGGGFTPGGTGAGGKVHKAALPTGCVARAQPYARGSRWQGRSVLTPCSPSARLSARPRLIPLPAHARRAFWACRCFGFAWNLASSQPVDMPAFDAALDRLPK